MTGLADMDGGVPSATTPAAGSEGEMVVSIEHALGLLAKAKGELLVLLQDGDHDGRDWTEWGDWLYEAVTSLTEAMQYIDRARLYQ
jgi:hypothetical protein